MIDFAGFGAFPAWNFKARAADMLLTGKKVRVFEVALDGNFGVKMSKADVLVIPSCVTRCEGFPSNHFSPSSEQFVSSTRIPRNVTSFGGKCWKHPPSDEAVGRALSHVRGGAWRDGMHRGDLHRSSRSGRGLTFSADLLDAEQRLKLLQFADGARALEDREMHSNSRNADNGRTFPANPISSRPERRK
jgi:hypothetical protein